MERIELPELSGSHFYFVGLKGTGMAALAEVLTAGGAHITGSDVAEPFYTDAILARANIPVLSGFDAAHLPERADLIVYSAAYDPQTHVELLAARERGIPMIPYNEALGALSRRRPSAAIAGVHGKTTTSALAAAIVERLGLPWTVLAGSALGVKGDTSTLIQGDALFIAETCEYRRHFLSFSPEVIVITSVEADHLDYFRSEDDILAAFVEFAERLPEGGTLIYCCDDPGADRVAVRLGESRPDVHLISYGTSATADMTVTSGARAAGTQPFRIGAQSFQLHVPGAHNMLNATAAVALVEELIRRHPDGLLSEGETSGEQTSGATSADSPARPGAGIADARYPLVQSALSAFGGTKRRGEVVGAAAGVLVLDDYAHHPTAIRKMLAGLRDFYPDRRVVLSFMSHTYSRTVALLDAFADALCGADILVLHDIYASAREANPGGVDGHLLESAVRDRAATVDKEIPIHYADDPEEALPVLQSILEPGDLFVTMGAGDNWRLGIRWLETAVTEVKA